MTDYERQKLIVRFRAHGTIMWTEIDMAADEIERLAVENRDLWAIIRKFQNDVLVAERERDEVLCRVRGQCDD
jgi:hypothetical protein